MRDPTETARPLGDDTHAVVARPKWAAVHGIRTGMEVFAECFDRCLGQRRSEQHSTEGGVLDPRAWGLELVWNLDETACLLGTVTPLGLRKASIPRSLGIRTRS